MNPANIRLDEEVWKTSFVFVFWRRLQDVLIKTNMFALALRLQDVFKTSWSRPIYSSWLYVFKKSSRRFQDVFKTSSRCFEDVFKMSSKHLQDLFKASSRRLGRRKIVTLKTCWRRLQDQQMFAGKFWKFIFPVFNPLNKIKINK